MKTHSKSGRATSGRHSFHPKTYAAPAHAVLKPTKTERKKTHRKKMDDKRKVRHAMWLNSVPWYARQMVQRSPKRHAAVLGLSRLHPKHPEFRGVC